MKHAPIPPKLVDNGGEDDLTFFSRRPGVNSRNRLAFDNEPPPGLLPDEYINVTFIRVRIERDPAGQPSRISRRISYGEWGHA